MWCIFKFWVIAILFLFFPVKNTAVSQKLIIEDNFKRDESIYILTSPANCTSW